MAALFSVSTLVQASPLMLQQDTIPGNDSLRFPLQDRRGDAFSQRKKNPFDLKDPANLTDSIIYDPKTKEYYIIEKVGGKYFRKPTSISFDDFMRIQSRKAESDYFQKKSQYHQFAKQKTGEAKTEHDRRPVQQAFRYWQD